MEDSCLRFSIVHFYPSNRTDKSAKDAPTRSGCPTTKLLHAKATVQGWLELYSLQTLDQNLKFKKKIDVAKQKDSNAGA